MIFLFQYILFVMLQGCQYYVTESIQSLFNSIGGIGLGFGFFEATAAVVAMQHMEGVI